ncbi:YceI family protein [Polaribacter sp.]|nr:YceI family protein [Polaribacter sp.]
MKKALFFLFFSVSISGFSQTYFTRTGTTDFKASVSAFEPVQATNKSTTVILKTTTGDLAAQLFMTAFQFRVALMQEHFNENYMDSNRHPKAVFRGKLAGFNFTEVSIQKEYNLSGTLTIRGVKKEINTTATVTLDGDKIILSSKFTVAPQDFNIAIPKIVRKKIAENIHITLNYELVEKK